MSNDTYEEDGIEYCDACKEPTDDCECERCDGCGGNMELVGTCECDECEHCREKEHECSCELCNTCGVNLTVLNSCLCEREEDEEDD